MANFVYIIGVGENRVLLGLCVDDMFMIAALLEKLGVIKGFFSKTFKMKDLGPVNFLLGMEIRLHPNGDIHLLQEK